MRTYLLFLVFLFMPQIAQAADPLLLARIVVCESGSKPSICGDDGVSCGIAQFRKETFYEFAAAAGLKKAHWMNMYDQIYLLNWGLDHGYGRRWTCYRKIKGEM